MVKNYIIILTNYRYLSYLQIFCITYIPFYNGIYLSTIMLELISTWLTFMRVDERNSDI